jgi:hypothetical protein
VFGVNRKTVDIFGEHCKVTVEAMILVRISLVLQYQQCSWFLLLVELCIELNSVFRFGRFYVLQWLYVWMVMFNGISIDQYVVCECQTINP